MDALNAAADQAAHYVPFYTQDLASALQYPAPTRGQQWIEDRMNAIEAEDIGITETGLTMAAIYNDFDEGGGEEHNAGLLSAPDLDENVLGRVLDVLLEADALECLFSFVLVRPTIVGIYAPEMIGIALDRCSTRCLKLLSAIASTERGLDLRCALRSCISAFAANLPDYDADFARAFCDSILVHCRPAVDDRIGVLLALANRDVEPGVREIVLASPVLKLREVFRSYPQRVAAAARSPGLGTVLKARMAILHAMLNNGPG